MSTVGHHHQSSIPTPVWPLKDPRQPTNLVTNRHLFAAHARLPRQAGPGVPGVTQGAVAKSSGPPQVARGV